MANPDLDYSKLDVKLFAAVNRTSKDSFNNASFEVFIRAKTPISPGDYPDMSGQPIPGVSIRGVSPSLIQTGTVTGSGLVLLSKDPNIMSLSGATTMRPM